MYMGRYPSCFHSVDPVITHLYRACGRHVWGASNIIEVSCMWGIILTHVRHRCDARCGARVTAQWARCAARHGHDGGAHFKRPGAAGEDVMCHAHAYAYVHSCGPVIAVLLQR